MQLNRFRLFAVILSLLLSALLSACASTALAKQRRYERKQAQAELARAEKPGLLLGDYPLAEEAVIDGDTIRVDGLGASLRLLGIDTEETFKKDSERRAFDQGWEQYLAAMKGDAKRPVKMATPVGEEAKVWARAFLAGAKSVRLERDHPKEIRDFFDRYLAYILVERDGKWLNFSIESVRAGMSPYFTKYGLSRRFHSEFLAAEQEARDAKRGIWDPAKQHYPDYDERKVWWDTRGNFLHAFEKNAEQHENHVVLTHYDALDRIERHEGKEIVLLGSVGDIHLGASGPSRVTLNRRQRQGFNLIFFDKDVFLSSGIAARQSQFVTVRGTVTRYKNKHNGKEELQIVVSLPGQIGSPFTVGAPNVTN